MPTKTTTTDLQNQIDTLTEQLNTERAKISQFGSILGQLRFRVTDVLELDPPTRTTILEEIDAVFRRAL